MKTCCVILLLGLSSGFAQAPSATSSPTADPVCGFIAGPHYYYEAADVKQGLSASLFVGEARADRPVTLRFFIHEEPRGIPVSNLQVEHQKLIHVIGLRDDLNGFFHLHPLRVEPGLWVVTHTFTNGGNYKIWTDVKYRGAAYSFGHPLLSVAGSLGALEKRDEMNASQTVSGYRVTFRDSGPLVAGSTNQLQFSIQNASGKSVETENFLGAPMHLVIVRDDLSVYLHAHPEIRGAGDPAIRFNQQFPREGTYKLFAQFRPREGKLPPDEALLAEFYVKVGKGSLASVNGPEK